jgi:hypothetical protein
MRIAYVDSTLVDCGVSVATPGSHSAWPGVLVRFSPLIPFSFWSADCRADGLQPLQIRNAASPTTTRASVWFGHETRSILHAPKI